MGGRAAQGTVALSFRLKLWLSLVVLAVLWWLTANRPLEIRLAYFLLGLSLLAQTYLEFAVYIFRGQQRLLVEAGYLTAGRLLTAAVALLLLWLDGGLVAVALAYFLATSAVAIWALRHVQREGWLALPAGEDRPPAGRLLRQAFPLGVAIFLSIGYTRLAVFMLEYQMDEAAVAEFSAALRLVEPMQIIPAALLAAVFPAFTHALHHEPRQAHRLGLHSSLLLGGMAAVLAIVFWFGAPWLIPLLYGPSFVAAIPVLQFLGLSALPAFVNYSLTHILIARGQQRLSSIFVALMVVLHGLLSWQLIPTMGPAGPAFSVVMAEIVLFVCCLLTLLFTRPGWQRATVNVSSLSSVE